MAFAGKSSRGIADEVGIAVATAIERKSRGIADEVGIAVAWSGILKKAELSPCL